MKISLIQRPVRIACALLIAACSQAAGAQEARVVELPSQEPQADVAAFESYLDGVMAGQFVDRDLAGATFALVVDGELVLAKGYGYADLDSTTRVDPAVHLFRPGSVSKLFTWTAVMQLVEQGKVQLDAPVSEYVDQFPIPGDYGAITLENILTHTPGLEDGAFGYLFSDDPEDLIPLEEALATYTPAQMWAPGTVPAYSNWATALAGLIVANVSGLSFEQYVDRHIFQPLRMANSTFDEPLPDALAANMATGYFTEGKGLEVLGYEYIKNFGPAGALASTATDMANFIIAHVQDGAFGDDRILEAETAQRMRSRLFTLHQSLSGMAHGFYEINRNGQRFVAHGGDTIAFHSNLVIDPDDDFGFFVSFNTPEGALARSVVSDAVIDYFYPQAGLPVTAELQGSKERISEIAGAYRVNRHSYTKLESLMTLPSDIGIAPVDDNRIVIPSPIVDAVFVEVEPYVFREQYGQSLIAFETDDDGSVLRGYMGDIPIMSLEKLVWYEAGGNHIAVIALALLSALFVIINTLRNWRANREATGIGIRAVWAAFTVSALNILFVAGFGAVMAGANMRDMLFGFPPAGTAVLLVLPLLSAVATAALVVLTVLVWKNGVWGRWKRVRLSYVALVNVLFVLVLNYWNVLGWKYY